MFVEFFVVGSILFWALTFTLFVVLTAFVASENNFFATVSVIAYILAINLFGDAHTLMWVKDNAGPLLIGAIVYLIVGIGWSIWKWWFFNMDIAEKLLQVKRDILGPLAMKDTEIPADKIAKFYSERDILQINGRPVEFPVRALRYKSRIIGWMSYWPLSLLCTLLDDFFRKLYHRIYSFLQKQYQAITERVFGKFNHTDTAAKNTDRK